MNRCLLLDTNFSATPIYESLEVSNQRVYVMGNRPDDTLAIIAPNYVEENYTDLQAVKSFIVDHDIDFLVPGCTDASYATCCALALDSTFPGYETPKSLSKLHYKDEFRDLCRELGIAAPRVFKSLDQVASDQLNVIVKPIDSFSGKGINVLAAPSKAALSNAVAEAKEYSASGRVVIEEFVTGGLHSYSAFLRDGRVQVAFSVAEFCSVNPFVVDTSYVLEKNRLERYLRDDVEKLAAALKIASGLLHVQYIATEEEYWLIEATRRCPGDLYSKLISMSTGYPYAQAYAANFIGEALPSISGAGHRFVVRYTLTGKRFGHLKSIGFNKPAQIAHWYQLKQVGAVMSPSPGGRVGIGFFEESNSFEQDKRVADLIAGRVFQLEYSEDPQFSGRAD